MTVKIKCKCGKTLRVPVELAGKKVACPGCKKCYRVAPETFAEASPKFQGGRPIGNAPTTGKSAAESAPPQRVSALEMDSAPSEIDITPSQLDLLGESPAAQIEDTYGLAAGEPEARQTATHLQALQQPLGPPKVCRSCGREWPANAKICTTCGIDLKSGRSLLTSDDSGVDQSYVTAEKVIQVLSWFVWLGVYPIASEAFGTKKPHAARSIAILTILISAWFLTYEWTGSAKMRSMKNLMLWSGEATPDPEHLVQLYALTNFGNSEAFFAELDAIEQQQESSDSQPADQTTEGAEAAVTEDLPPVLRAHHALPVHDRCIGEYHWWQLITNTFLHAGPLHLAGNLLFLLIFGSRVNTLIGTPLTLALYPLLGIAGSIGHMLSMKDAQPHPALGASGAIMGLAGMYLVFFPVHKVHVAAWVRLGLIFRFRLKLSFFAIRGFWVVLFYIGFDVVYTVLRIKDDVAHWAHLGGFLIGVFFALMLLVTRAVNARGGDLISAILGRRAWAILGSPSRAMQPSADNAAPGSRA